MRERSVYSDAYGRDTLVVDTLEAYKAAVSSYGQTNFHCRGEPREYGKPWQAGVWRQGHDYGNRLPVTPGGFYTEGEFAALKSCLRDWQNGVISDSTFARNHATLGMGIELRLNSPSLYLWTSLAQHYNEGQRYPTRLLDVTRDPLVALYFATESSFDQDGFVQFLQPGSYNDLSSWPSLKTAGTFLDVLRISASDGGDDYRPQDDTLNLASDSYLKGGLTFRIPAESKPHIKVDLSADGFNHSTLFPEDAPM